ncbi:MAG TPA: hypothetical protein VKU85_19995, partial [bacterium]|nr:hypothetical protein [bacterium]
ASHLTRLPVGDVFQPDSTGPALGATVQTLRLGGESYRVYVQPFYLPVSIAAYGADTSVVTADESGAGASAEEEENPWYIGGFLAEGTLRAESMRVSPSMVLLVAGVLVWGFLTLPYLRIRHAGPRDPVTVQDAVVLAVAMVVGAAVGGFALMDLVMYQDLKGQRDVELKYQAEQLQESLNRELGSVQRILGNVIGIKNAGRRAPGRGEAKEQGEVGEDGRAGADGSDNHDHDDDSLRVAVLADSDTTPFESYPLVNMAIFMDRDGQQVQKWSVKNSNTSLINVATREYFRAVRERRNLWPSPACSSMFVESIRSRTTGRVEAVISAPDSGEGVAAVDVPLASAIGPVLPAGMRFAVFDRAGRVQFHSDDERNLRENFFRDAYSDVPLAELARSGKSLSVNLVYRAEEMRSYVRPYRHAAGASSWRTPWTIAVFTSREPARMFQLEVLTFALMLFGAFFVVVLLVAVWSHYAEQGKKAPGEAHRQWYWPTAEHVGRYVALLATWIVLLAGWGVLMVAGEESVVAVVCLLFPVGAVLAVHLVGRLDVPIRWAAYGKGGVTDVVLLLSFLAGLLGATGAAWSVPGGSSAAVTLAGLSGLGILLKRRLLPVYLALVLLCVHAGAISLGTLPGREGLVAAATLLAALAVGALLRTEVFTESEHGARWERRRAWFRTYWRRFYVLAAAGLPVMLGALPAVTFYRSVWDEQVVLSARESQLRMAQALARRAEAQVDRHRDITISSGNRIALDELLFPRSLSDAPDVYVRDGEKIEMTKAGDDRADRERSPVPLVAVLSSLAPRYSAESAFTRCLAGTSAVGEFEWVASDSADTTGPFVNLRVPRARRSI